MSVGDQLRCIRQEFSKGQVIVFRHVHQSVILLVTMICLFFILLMINLFPKITYAGDSPMSLSNKLKNLVDQKLTIVVRFTEPIAGEKFWIIPESIGDDKTGLRSLSEVGLDYFCVREAGTGAIDVKCVPFTNIAQITYEDT